jgi:Lhr-like helicase
MFFLSQNLIWARPVQREVIVATLDGEDVFLQAATSFGKSLCYQLPAVVDFGSKHAKYVLESLLTGQSHHCHITAAGLDGMCVKI